MSGKEAEKLFRKGVEAVDSGNMVSALGFFERAASIEDTPANRSYYAFCIARERGQFKKAVSMCEEAMKEEPQNAIHYLNLGRVYLLTGQRSEAMQILRDGLQHEENKDIVDELVKLGMRKPPVIPVLKRENLLNKYIGIILTRLGIR